MQSIGASDWPNRSTQTTQHRCVSTVARCLDLISTLTCYQHPFTAVLREATSTCAHRQLNLFLALCVRSPYVFALATSVNATPYDAGVIKSPATVFAVLKETNELVHQFVIRRGAGGLAVVP